MYVHRYVRMYKSVEKNLINDLLFLTYVRMYAYTYQVLFFCFIIPPMQPTYVHAISS